MRLLFVFIFLLSSSLTAFAADLSWAELHQRQLIQKFPEWKKFIYDPAGKSRDWIVNKHWQKLSDLIEANIDPELNRVLGKELFKGPAVRPEKDLQIEFIQKADQRTLANLVVDVFSQPQAQEMSDLIQLTIQKSDGSVLSALARYTFSKPFAEGMGYQIYLTIEKGGENTLRNLVEYTFSNPHTAKMDNLLTRILKKTTALDSVVVESVLLRSHSKYMTGSLRIIIERASPETLMQLAHDVFSRPHTKDVPELLELALEKSTPEEIDAFFRSTFSKEHTWKMYRALRLALSKSDASGFWVFVRNVLSQEHAKDKKFLLRQELEQGTPEVLADFPRFVLSDAKLLENNKDLIRIFIEKAEFSLLVKEQKNILAGLKEGDANLISLSAALKIQNREDRARFLENTYVNQDLLRPFQRSTFVDNLNRVKGISPQLRLGQVLRVEGRFFKVTRPGVVVEDIMVFQVLEENKGYYALKVAMNSSPDTLARLATETQKDAIWQRLGVPHSKVVLQRENHVIKTWVAGVNGAQLLRNRKLRTIHNDGAFEKLTEFIEALQSKGVDVDRIAPADLIWNGKVWVVIDSGDSLRNLLTEGQVKTGLCSKVF